MDDFVLAAMARWPNVPEVYGWLSLDRRGRWRIKGEVVSNAALVAFIGRNYDVDARGGWYFQNGPQRVFVALEYTPWILHLVAPGRLETHTGLPVAQPRHAYLDEEGNLLIGLGNDLGSGAIGLISDRDLAMVIEGLTCADGSAADTETVEQVLAHGRIPTGIELQLQGFGAPLPVTFATAAEIDRIGGHQRNPVPAQS